MRQACFLQTVVAARHMVTDETDGFSLTLESTAPQRTRRAFMCLRWDMNRVRLPLNCTGPYKRGRERRASSLKPQTQRQRVFLLLIVTDLMKGRQRGFRRA